MKIIVSFKDRPKLVVDDAQVVRVLVGKDNYRMTEVGDGNGLLVRLEEHDNQLTLDLAVFPDAGNGIRLKGGLR